MDPLKISILPFTLLCHPFQSIVLSSILHNDGQRSDQTDRKIPRFPLLRSSSSSPLPRLLYCQNMSIAYNFINSYTNIATLKCRPCSDRLLICIYSTGFNPPSAVVSNRLVVSNWLVKVLGLWRSRASPSLKNVDYHTFSRVSDDSDQHVTWKATNITEHVQNPTDRTRARGEGSGTDGPMQGRPACDRDATRRQSRAPRASVSVTDARGATTTTNRCPLRKCQIQTLPTPEGEAVPSAVSGAGTGV